MTTTASTSGDAAVGDRSAAPAELPAPERRGVEIISQKTRQIGQVAVTFTVGRIKREAP